MKSQPGIDFSVVFFSFLNFSLFFFFDCSSRHFTSMHNIITKTTNTINVTPIAKPKIFAKSISVCDTHVLHSFADMLNYEKPQKYKLSD